MPTPPRPPGIQSILDELANAQPFASLGEVNRHLARRMQDYNTQPQTELGGLSPDQTSQLLSGDWEGVGAFRVAEDTPLELLRDSAFLADARTLLRYISDHAPVKLTDRGNLPRAAVAALVPQLRMLAEALFALLFRTFFRQLDLRFLCMDDRHPGLQPTIAYSFYKLSRVGDDWMSADVLAARAWLESARDPMNAMDVEYGDRRHHAFRRRVLDPLAMFGMLERRLVPGEEPWREVSEYRRTAMYVRVLRFEFRGGGRGDVFMMR